MITVDMSEKPTSHVGSAAAIASQSSSGSRSIAVSPPHGGTTARTAGSVSIAVSSRARSWPGALTWPEPSMQSPTTTSKPRARTVARATSRRALEVGGDPARG